MAPDPEYVADLSDPSNILGWLTCIGFAAKDHPLRPPPVCVQHGDQGVHPVHAAAVAGALAGRRDDDALASLSVAFGVDHDEAGRMLRAAEAVGLRR